VLPLVGELGEIIARQRQNRPYTTRTGQTALCLYVFHRHGEPIGEFRKAWSSACITAGFARPKLDAAGRPVVDRRGRPVIKSALIFHDLRRSAVRNLVAAGVDQAVAMRVTGHQTISVFQRYRIVSEDDVRMPLERTQAAPSRIHAHDVPTSGQGHNSGHNG
jgi:integrase